MKRFIKVFFVLIFAGQSVWAQLPKPAVSINSFKEQRISAMPLSERIKRGIVPQRGLCSTSPGKGGNDMMISGSGKMRVDVNGDPLAEQVTFHRERIQVPWPADFAAPKIAYVLPDVRKMIMDGKYKDALDLSLKASADAGITPGGDNHGNLPAFSMRVATPGNGMLTNYLRTTNFENGEIKVLWTDKDGEYVRRTFVSRPDDLVVQLFEAPQGKVLNTKISIATRGGGGGVRGGTVARSPVPVPAVPFRVETVTNGNNFIIKGHFSPGNSGYAGVVRVVLNGGSVKADNGSLVIENAKSVTLITRIEWYSDFQQQKVDELINAVNKVIPDYNFLLARNAKIQSEMFDRASLSFKSTKEERAMSGEELLISQHMKIGYNPALLEKMFDIGRYWYMQACGDFPPMAGHLNINVNLQNAPGVMANLPESSGAFYSWIEGILPDAKTNAKNIFGTRGALFSVHPDQQTGVLYHFDWVWPHHYWISAGGWAYSPFWDHYLATGDKEFLRKDIMPGLRELGLFYEDYLSSTDKFGNYIFVPSYSPENWPSNTNEGQSHKDGEGSWVNAPVVINATMDIMVCREVLTHLIEGASILHTDADKIPKWKDMLAKMPPYITDKDGAIKEWTWPTLDERLDHRHASHLYGVWPADEIDPDRTPELAKSAWIADRKHAQGNASGHGISHRMLAAARLKDNYLVNMELKQLLEQGYVGTALTTSHNPYTTFMPDQQGSILAVLMEMLVYSREGVIEVLPALPVTLDKGSIKGILSRSFAKVDDLTWDMNAKTANVTLTSLKKQDLTFIARHGMTSITAPAGVLSGQPKPGATTCVLHLPANKPITLNIKLGNQKPSDWINKVSVN